jgi:hypothetical protein
MSTPGILALLFKIAQDPAKAQQVVDDLEASTATQLQDVAAHFDELQEKSSDALKSLPTRLAFTADEFERLHGQLLNMTQEVARLGEETERAAARAAGSNRPLSRNVAGVGSPLPEDAAVQKSAQAHQSAARAVQAHQTALVALRSDIPTLAMPIRAELIPALTEADASVGNITRRLNDQLAPSFARSGEAARTFGEVVENGFLRATNASNKAVAAESARLAATLGSRRIAAGIEAVWETAKGIAALAEWDFRGAALHFMSAAEYGIVAGTGGRHHGAGAGGYGGREPRYLGPEGQGIENRQSKIENRGGGGTSVHVYIQGDFLNTPGTQAKLGDMLADYVMNKDGYLPASHVKDSTLTRDSLNG